MIPKKLVPVLFGFLVAGIMTFIVSGISTWSSLGRLDWGLWMGNWAFTWAVAFPVILFVAPAVRAFLTKHSS